MAGDGYFRLSMLGAGTMMRANLLYSEARGASKIGSSSES